MMTSSRLMWEFFPLFEQLVRVAILLHLSRWHSIASLVAPTLAVDSVKSHIKLTSKHAHASYILILKIYRVELYLIEEYALFILILHIVPPPPVRRHALRIMLEYSTTVVLYDAHSLC